MLRGVASSHRRLRGNSAAPETVTLKPEVVPKADPSKAEETETPPDSATGNATTLVLVSDESTAHAAAGEEQSVTVVPAKGGRDAKTNGKDSNSEPLTDRKEQPKHPQEAPFDKKSHALATVTTDTLPAAETERENSTSGDIEVVENVGPDVSGDHTKKKSKHSHSKDVASDPQTAVPKADLKTNETDVTSTSADHGTSVSKADTADGKGDSQHKSSKNVQGFFQGLKKHIEANNLLNATATNSTAGATVNMSMAEALFDDATADSTREEPDSTSKIENKKKKHKKKRKSNEAGKEEPKSGNEISGKSVQDKESPISGDEMVAAASKESADALSTVNATASTSGNETMNETAVVDEPPASNSAAVVDVVDVKETKQKDIVLEAEAMNLTAVIADEEKSATTTIDKKDMDSPMKKSKQKKGHKTPELTNTRVDDESGEVVDTMKTNTTTVDETKGNLLALKVESKTSKSGNSNERAYAADATVGNSSTTEVAGKQLDGDIVSPELIPTGNYTVEAANADTVDTKHHEEAAALSSELITTRNSTTEAATKKEEGDDDVSSELITTKNSTVKAASSVMDNMETIKNEVAAAVSSGLITTGNSTVKAESTVTVNTEVTKEEEGAAAVSSASDLITTGNSTSAAVSTATVDTETTKEEEGGDAVLSGLVTTGNSTVKAASTATVDMDTTKEEEGGEDVSSELIISGDSTIKAASPITVDTKRTKEEEDDDAVSSDLITAGNSTTATTNIVKINTDTKEEEGDDVVLSEVIPTGNLTTATASIVEVDTETKEEEGDDAVSSELIATGNLTTQAASTVTVETETTTKEEDDDAVSSVLPSTGNSTVEATTIVTIEKEITTKEEDDDAVSPMRLSTGNSTVEASTTGTLKTETTKEKSLAVETSKEGGKVEYTEEEKDTADDDAVAKGTSDETNAVENISSASDTTHGVIEAEEGASGGDDYVPLLDVLKIPKSVGNAAADDQGDDSVQGTVAASEEVQGGDSFVGESTAVKNTLQSENPPFTTTDGSDSLSGLSKATQNEFANLFSGTASSSHNAFQAEHGSTSTGVENGGVVAGNLEYNFLSANAGGSTTSAHISATGIDGTNTLDGKDDFVGSPKVSINNDPVETLSGDGTAAAKASGKGGTSHWQGSDEDESLKSTASGDNLTPESMSDKIGNINGNNLVNFNSDKDGTGTAELSGYSGADGDHAAVGGKGSNISWSAEDVEEPPKKTSSTDTATPTAIGGNLPRPNNNYDTSTKITGAGNAAGTAAGNDGESVHADTNGNGGFSTRESAGGYEDMTPNENGLGVTKTSSTDGDTGTSVDGNSNSYSNAGPSAGDYSTAPMTNGGSTVTAETYGKGESTHGNDTPKETVNESTAKSFWGSTTGSSTTGSEGTKSVDDSNKVYSNTTSSEGDHTASVEQPLTEEAEPDEDDGDDSVSVGKPPSGEAEPDEDDGDDSVSLGKAAAGKDHGERGKTISADGGDAVGGSSVIAEQTGSVGSSSLEGNAVPSIFGSGSGTTKAHGTASSEMDGDGDEDSTRPTIMGETKAKEDDRVDPEEDYEEDSEDEGYEENGETSSLPNGATSSAVTGAESQSLVGTTTGSIGKEEEFGENNDEDESGGLGHGVANGESVPEAKSVAAPTEPPVSVVLPPKIAGPGSDEFRGTKPTPPPKSLPVVNATDDYVEGGGGGVVGVLFLAIFGAIMYFYVKNRSKSASSLSNRQGYQRLAYGKAPAGGNKLSYASKKN